MYPAGSSPALLYTTVVGPFQGGGLVGRPGIWPAVSRQSLKKVLPRRATSGAR